MSNRPAPKPLLLYGLLACSLTLNVVMFFRGAPSEEPDAAAAIASPAVDDAVANAAAPAADAAAQAEPVEAEAGGSASAEWTVLRGKVEQSLARTFQIEAGEAGDALSSVFTRLFVWDLDLRRDLQKGDAIAVAWRTASDGLPEIAAAKPAVRETRQDRDGVPLARRPATPSQLLAPRRQRGAAAPE